MLTRASQKKAYIAWGLGGPQICEAPVVLFPRSQDALTLPENLHMTIYRVLPFRPWVQSCYWCLTAYAWWIESAVCESAAILVLQPPFPPQHGVGLKAQLSHHMVGLTGVNSPHHGTSPYHKLSGPVINNRSTSVLGNSENLEATSQELGTENNQILYSKGLTGTSQQSGRSHSKFVTLQIWRTRLLSSVVHRPIVHS